MKKIISFIFVFSLFFAVVSMSFSCKRCASCTFDDPAFGQDTSDFCGKGNSYKDQLDRHEKSGWKCIEN